MILVFSTVLAGNVKMIDTMCDTFRLLEQIISEFFCNGDNVIFISGVLTFPGLAKDRVNLFNLMFS